MTTAKAHVSGTGRAVRGEAVRAGARAGLAARGALYLLVGALAVRIGLTGTGEQADRGGAVAHIAATPFGAVLLWALGIGLAGMAAWRLSEAVLGAAGPKGDKAYRRALSAGRCVFYAGSAFLVLSFAMGERGSGEGSTDRQSRDLTARLLELPGGRWWVGAVAVGVLAAGLWIAGRAVLRKYRDHLAWGRLTTYQRRFMDVTGVAGGIGRGLVLAALGLSGVRAATAFDPSRAKGMDDAIRSFAQAPAGPWLLLTVAVGLVLFGAFSFGEAKWRAL
ncbi:DUF1206 domain-containing protein [Streptomyces sp. TLI_105]|uniref:DUF1206 domain-containing protein n=1 Tax=Streptomyces sp. TLI_105 TaxID=1881019 RepID=UPI000895775B|nr:DUF1206 domain-containing protein [Streptomyces sp. TLI_105]SEE06034.1 protein of unknown function [Streptomyces sp. TLI_105]